MNSEIELNSIPNEGSEFSFTIDFKIDKLKNEQKIVDENLKILLYCSDGNNDNLRQNIQNHVSKIGIISDYSNENRKGDILFCCGINNLDLVIEEFKTQNTKSQIIYVGDSSNITNNKIKEEINHYLELPIYGLKIYNILVQNTDIHKNIVKKSMEEQKFDGKILVAEDNPNNQKLLEILLTKMGIQTVIVSNGEEAVECYKKDKYDMILMDINMPIMDGITATKLIKDLEKDNYKIPIIALTANSIAGDEEKYLAQGMNNYLSKPINVAKLKELISIYLFSDEKL
jgi:CheY-like chemotaxis protein